MTCRAPENIKLAGNWPKMAVMCVLQEDSHICVVFKLIITITSFYASFFGLLDQFGWQSPFTEAHLGCWTPISEAIVAG